MNENTRTIKVVKIDATKCTGCCACEMICSAYHAETMYKEINVWRSRIKIFKDETNDLYVPIMAGPYTEVECNSRNVITINGKAYGECSFCRASCPSRDLFKDPDNPEIPLKCDLCGDPMPEGGPRCVQWCLAGALAFEEYDEPFDRIHEQEEKIIEEI